MRDFFALEIAKLEIDMPPLTIHDFDWREFWDTYHTLSWYECVAFICFVVAWFLFIGKTEKKEGSSDISDAFLLLTFVGSIFMILNKAFNCLDVRVLLDVFLALACIVKTIVHARVKNFSEDARQADRVLNREGRSSGRHSSSRSSSDSGSHGHRRRHHDSSGSTHSSEHSHRRHSHESSSEASSSRHITPYQPGVSHDINLDSDED